MRDEISDDKAIASSSDFLFSVIAANGPSVNVWSVLYGRFARIFLPGDMLAEKGVIRGS